MINIKNLLENNRKWSKDMTVEDPSYFRSLARQQTPKYLWIGCSDSRVPANEIVGLPPGDLFVHRNVGNLVYPTDLNCLSVVEYAVSVLGVSVIIVCGHYGCGGVQAAIEGKFHGGLDNWLLSIRDTYARNRDDVLAQFTTEQRLNRMCELNVVQQVKTLSHTTIIQNAWQRGQELSIVGWIYGLSDGLIKELGVQVDRIGQVEPTYRFSG